MLWNPPVRRRLVAQWQRYDPAMSIRASSPQWTILWPTIPNKLRYGDDLSDRYPPTRHNEVELEGLQALVLRESQDGQSCDATGILRLRVADLPSTQAGKQLAHGMVDLLRLVEKCSTPMQWNDLGYDRSYVMGRSR